MSAVTRQFGFKVKIVENYSKLFDRTFGDTLAKGDKEAFEFWKEFFLLKANPVELEKVLKQKLSNGQQKDRQYDHLSNNENSVYDIINLLFDQCVLIIETDDKLMQLNSMLTLYVILMLNLKQSKKSKVANSLSRERMSALNEKLLKLAEEEKSDVMMKLILKMYLCIVCRDEELNENDPIDLIATDQLFDRLLKIVSSSRINNTNQLNHLSIVMITLVQNNQNNLFTVRLSILNNEIALHSYAQVISRELYDFNQTYRSDFFNQKSSQGDTMDSIISALTGLVSFSSEPASKFEQTLLHTDNRSILLAFYDMIHLNRNFIPFLLSVQATGDETNNLLISFLEFVSIVICCLKEYFHKNESLQHKLINTTHLSFIILTCIVEDEFANSIMHDSNNVFNKVQVHRSKMRHRIDRKIEDKDASKRPIAYSILELLIEFLFSNMRKKHFPIDLYIFCNNIILKLMCYQIKLECRNDFQWPELWHSHFCLLKYLTSNYEKSDDLQVKRRSRLLLLANNVINLFNLFIIFGDTILHSPVDYDNLYYELLRNHDIVHNLGQLARHHSLSKKKDEREAAVKVLSSLENIESIVGHFISKINESKKDSPLSEDEIREIVRNNYDTLSIKVKDGLDIYENYEPEKMFFKKKVLKKIIEHIRITHLTNFDELIEDQNTILQTILNCSN